MRPKRKNMLEELLLAVGVLAAAIAILWAISAWSVITN